MLCDRTVTPGFDAVPEGGADNGEGARALGAQTISSKPLREKNR